MQTLKGSCCVGAGNGYGTKVRIKARVKHRQEHACWRVPARVECSMTTSLVLVTRDFAAMKQGFLEDGEGINL